MMAIPAQYLVLRKADNTGPDVDTAKSYVDAGEHVSMMPWEHRYLHEGDNYVASHFFGSIAQGNEIEMLIDVPSDADIEPHIIILPESGADVRLRLYEGTTTSNDGTAVTPRNRRRTVNSNPDQSEINVNFTPTIASSGDDGTVIDDQLFGGGSGPGASGAGAAGRAFEWILERGLKYLVRATNLSTTAANMAISFEWYEHEPIT